MTTTIKTDEVELAMRLTHEMSIHLLHHSREVCLVALQAMSAVVLTELNIPITFFADRLRTADQRLLGKPTPPARELLGRRMYDLHRASLVAQYAAVHPGITMHADDFDRLDPEERQAWIETAAIAEQPEPVRAACIHCGKDVAAIADVEAVRAHAVSCKKSPAVQKVQDLENELALLRLKIDGSKAIVDAVVNAASVDVNTRLCEIKVDRKNGPAFYLIDAIATVPHGG